MKIIYGRKRTGSEDELRTIRHTASRAGTGGEEAVPGDKAGNRTGH